MSAPIHLRVITNFCGTSVQRTACGMRPLWVNNSLNPDMTECQRCKATAAWKSAHQAIHGKKP